MPDTVLQIIAKDPKEQHVSEQMHEASMHEHRAKEIEINWKRRQVKLNSAGVSEGISHDLRPGEVDPIRDLFRHERKCICELIVRAELLQEKIDQHLGGNKQIINN